MVDDYNAQVCLNFNHAVIKTGKDILKFMKVFQELEKIQNIQIRGSKSLKMLF